MQSKSRTFDWYDFEAESYEETRLATREQKKRDRAIKERFLELLPLGRILELGVGTGRHAKFLASHGYDVIGIDLSKVMLTKASPCKTVRMDAEKLGFRPCSFDGIYCDRTFKFFVNPKRVLSMCNSLLRPNGILVLVLVHIACGLQRRYGGNRRLIVLKRLFRKKPHRVSWLERFSNIPVFAYDRDLIKSWLKNTGFTNIHLSTLFTYQKLFVSARKR